MRPRHYLLATLLPALIALSVANAAEPAANITWKKTVIAKEFLSEGVAIADVNKDGKMDVIHGELWYEAPSWTKHRVRKGPDDFTKGKDNVYSESFAVWAEDYNGDGWTDILVIPFPGKPCNWYENPKGKDEMWKEHQVWHSACNETPTYLDLFGNGKKVLLMGWQPKGQEEAGQMAYFTPGKDPNQLWDMHPISELSIPATFKVTPDALKAMTADKVPEAVVAKLDGLKEKEYANANELMTAASKVLSKEELDPNKAKIQKAARVPGKEVPGTRKFSHGLGAGDVNGDGRFDVVCTGGWWEQPAKVEDKPWKFHPVNLGPECADMFSYDVDGDKKADLISSSAHQYGIWWHQQRGDSGEPAFMRQDLFPRLVSQTHAMHCVDINGDGLKDLVTGKRWWAHGATGDADPGAPAKVYWFEAQRGADGIVKFTPHEIDDDSGIGTQFEVADFNGDKLLDIIVANKKGVFVIEQVRKK